MSNQVNEAVAALRKGDQARAQELLQERLNEQPTDAMAWLWMSEATPDVRRKVEALSRFLTLEPSHTHAASVRGRLEQLQAQLAAMPPVIERDEPRPAPPAAAEPPAPAPEPLLTQDNVPAAASSVSAPDRMLPSAGSALVYDDQPEEDPTDESALPPHSFSPRPAAPPPPDFQATRGESAEDEGLPMWVWLLMVLSLVLVALFIYLILNFDQFRGFLPQ